MPAADSAAASGFCENQGQKQVRRTAHVGDRFHSGALQQRPKALGRNV